MFTPLHSLFGADLLHLATSQHLELAGRPLGISGILNGSVFGDRDGWRWTFLMGMIGSALIGSLAGLGAGDIGWGVRGYGEADGSVGGSLGRRVVAGLLVGFGSKLGSGCTSGHFLCGISRLSPRSIIASITFFLSATFISNIFPHPIFNSLGPTSNHIPTLWPSMKEGFPHLLAVPITFRVFYAVVLPRILKRSKTSESTYNTKRAETVLGFISGVTFGTGLLLSGMVSPAKTLGFMRLPFMQSFQPGSKTMTTRGWSEWDPSLAMIIIAAVLPNIRHWLIRIQPRINQGSPPKLYQGTPQTPISNWQIPLGSAAWKIDTRLILGSIIFGTGWGLGGVCPGPAVVRLGVDGLVRSEGWVLVGSVLAGMKVAGFV